MKKIFVSRADLIDKCPHCGEPTCGRYDCDESKNISLECVNCHKKTVYERTEVQFERPREYED